MATAPPRPPSCASLCLESSTTRLHATSDTGVALTLSPRLANEIPPPPHVGYVVRVSVLKVNKLANRWCG